MTAQTVPEAWVRIPTEEEMRANTPPGQTGAYQFGFIPAMGLLLAAHDQIAPAFFNLYRQIMFAPGHLSRKEREMIAGVAASAQDCHY